MVSVSGVVALTALALSLASAACGGGDDQPQTVTAIGLFELELPDGWSVIVPTATDEELSPVLSVGTRVQPVSDRVAVIVFDGTTWDTPQAAADDWTERSSVALDFEAFEEDGVAHLRDGFTVTNPDGEAVGESIIYVLARPGAPEEAWLVVVCGSGPGRVQEATEGCDRVLATLEPWEFPELDP
ncbi:MAG: hypothetical protein WD557_13680 [Dehalococcoidia bacterium]